MSKMTKQEVLEFVVHAYVWKFLLIENCVNADVKFLNKLLASICWSGLYHGNYNRIWQTGGAHTKRITSIASLRLHIAKSLNCQKIWELIYSEKLCLDVKSASFWKHSKIPEKIFYSSIGQPLLNYNSVQIFTFLDETYNEQ